MLNFSQRGFLSAKILISYASLCLHRLRIVTSRFSGFSWICYETRAELFLYLSAHQTRYDYFRGGFLSFDCDFGLLSLAATVLNGFS